MKEASLMLVSVVGIFIIALASGEPMPGSEHVCNRTEFVPKEILVNKPVEYKVQVDGQCGWLPCKKTVTESRINRTRETIYKEVTRRGCCEGYAETPERTCAPICLKSCQYGKCIRPNKCECDPKPTDNSPGYVGTVCNRFVCLANDRWGPSCDKQCHKQCPDTAFCDARTGKCVCLPGWRGANCTEECDSRSDCPDVSLLPAIYEPEVNLIKTDDNVAGRMSALSLESSGREVDSEDKKAFSRMLMTHMQINLLLMLLATCLVFGMFWYKKKLVQLKNELYYSAYSGSGSRGPDSTGYSSVYDANSTIRGRPRMPLPNEGPYLSKNLSFDAATRNALTTTPEKGGNHLSSKFSIPINSKTERHLVASKTPSEQNVYSDIESNFEGQSVDGVVVADQQKLPTNGVQDDNVYQVPKSPASPAPQSDESNSHTNLYEEINPNSPARAETRK